MRLVAVGVLAFVVRLTPVLLGGGLHFYGRYDDGVYYAAADALTFGRVPYRDFVLLHPPGITLVLAPFALLGRVTSDSFGMSIGRLAFMAIGAMNAVLVTAIADRWSRRAAVAAGLIYACWLSAVYAEQSTLLEPLGGAAVLVALLLLVKTARPPTRRAEVLAGVVLGLSASIKIWYVAPWGVVVLWLLLVRRGWSAARIAVSGGVALTVVLAPFLILAPGRMFDMVVRDQLLRPQGSSSRLHRLSGILGVRGFVFVHHNETVVVTTIAVIVMIAAAVLCWTDRSARALVGMLAVTVLVLLASPSYFPHYAALSAGPGALVLGVAVGRLSAPRRRPSATKLVLVVLAVAVLASGVRVATTHEGKPFPTQLGAAAPAGCITSDDPGALIQMNLLSRDLGSGCVVPVDVTGITYDTLHRKTSRLDNRPWQRYLYHFLISGSAFVVARSEGDQMAPSIARALARQPALARADGLVLRKGNGSS